MMVSGDRRSLFFSCVRILSERLLVRRDAPRPTEGGPNAWLDGRERERGHSRVSFKSITKNSIQLTLLTYFKSARDRMMLVGRVGLTHSQGGTEDPRS